MSDDVFERMWEAICAFTKRRDGAPLNKHTGCWHAVVDEHWQLWGNGHAMPKAGGPNGDMQVPAFTIYVEFNGWPAGFISPAEITLAAGECANADTFIAALNAPGGDSRG